MEQFEQNIDVIRNKTSKINQEFNDFIRNIHIKLENTNKRTSYGPGSVNYNAGRQHALEEILSMCGEWVGTKK